MVDKNYPMDIEARIKRANQNRPTTGIVRLYFKDGTSEEMKYENKLDRYKIITMASAYDCTHYVICPDVYITELRYFALDENYPEIEE